MLRRVTMVLVQTHRTLSRTCVLHEDSFKSAYSLEKLYPKSNIDITAADQNINHAPAQVSNSDQVFDGHIPADKLTVKYSCSSGPGGQNVNKVHTKVDTRFHVASAAWLPLHVRQKILEKKKNIINKKGELIVTSERTRSQLNNFSDCLQKIRDIVEEVQWKPKEISEETRAVLRMRVEKANRERLRTKKLHSATKSDRKVMFD